MCGCACLCGLSQDPVGFYALERGRYDEKQRQMKGDPVLGIDPALKKNEENIYDRYCPGKYPWRSVKKCKGHAGSSCVRMQIGQRVKREVYYA